MMPVGDPAAAWLEGGQAVTEDSTFISEDPNSTTAVRPNPSITAIDSLQIERLKVGIVSILLSFLEFRQMIKAVRDLRKTARW